MLPQSGSSPKEAWVREASSDILPVVFMRPRLGGNVGCHCDAELIPSLSTDSRV